MKLRFKNRKKTMLTSLQFKNLGQRLLEVEEAIYPINCHSMGGLVVSDMM